MLNNLQVIAIVPARGGSKGIRYKNLCKVGGISLIEWAALLVNALPWVDRALLSTDDSRLANEGKRTGLSVPFIRPKELATDTALGIDVWRHAWLSAEKYWKTHFDISVYLQPTTPLRRLEHIEKVVNTLVKGSFDAATTIASVPGHFVPEKILQIDSKNVVRPFIKGKAVSNRQDAPVYYYRTGACYAAWRETIIEKRAIIEHACAGIIIEEPTANIDTPMDLEWANYLHKKYYSNLIEELKPLNQKHISQKDILL